MKGIDLEIWDINGHQREYLRSCHVDSPTLFACEWKGCFPLAVVDMFVLLMAHFPSFPPSFIRKTYWDCSSDFKRSLVFVSNWIKFFFFFFFLISS